MDIRKNYILFIDESGKSKFSDPGDHFLLSGLIIDRDLHTALSHYMVSLKEKSQLPIMENIHAYHLFEAEKEKKRDKSGRVIKNKSGAVQYKRISYRKVNTFFKRLSFLVEGADMKCFTYRVDKKLYLSQIRKVAQANKKSKNLVIEYLKKKLLGDVLYEVLARKLILEFGHFLEKEDAYGEVIAESRRDDDHAVSRAFLSATKESCFLASPRYQSWSKFCYERIHSITFQNKKGLTFGLEVADLFGWTHFNDKYGMIIKPGTSAAKVARVKSRIDKINRIMKDLYMKKAEDISSATLKTIGSDRVSEFTEALKEFN